MPDTDTVTDTHHTGSTTDENPRRTGGAGSAAGDHRVGPPEFSPETGSPAFSKGGHGVHDPPPGAAPLHVRDRPEGEGVHRGQAQPERR